MLVNWQRMDKWVGERERKKVKAKTETAKEGKRKTMQAETEKGRERQGDEL